MHRYPKLNYSGSDWAAFESWLNSELMDVYKELAGMGTDAATTERLRGRAHFIQLLLDFKNDAARDSLSPLD